MVAGVASANLLNQPMTLCAGTQDFATGDGTAIVKFAYRVHSGLS
jgi:hypothetical protein